MKMIDDLMADVAGIGKVEKHKVVDTISSILKEYNLSSDMDFTAKIATMRFDNKNEDIDLSTFPTELHDAAFLPTNTIAEIAIKHDIDLVMSQIPEWFVAKQIVRDAICESDVVTGQLARTIKFERSNADEENVISAIEDVEDKLGLHTIIKNQIIDDVLTYGEANMYAIPYSKIFSDLYNFKKLSREKKNNKTQGDGINMFTQSPSSYGYGYTESFKEKSLYDMIITEQPASSTKKNNKKQSIFTEAEIMEVNPTYYNNSFKSDDEKKKHDLQNDEFDQMLINISKSIRLVDGDVPIPILEELTENLVRAHEIKYSSVEDEFNDVKKDISNQTIFEQVMNDSNDSSDSVDTTFSKTKGIYLKVLPATKLIPIRVDRTIIGYYYISDLTRPEERGERKNSGVSGYSLRTPSVGNDTFNPTQMFCDKLASKIINNFNLKFVKDNTAIHAEIAAVLQAHKFNESLMRFIFIPAECIINFSINRDSMGRGHSMFEPALVAGRMYMFLKLYSVLFQINNSQVRVYNMRVSGLDKNYRKTSQEMVRKLAARRMTTEDIYNNRSSMSKVNGGSELIMPIGPSGNAPLEISQTEALNSPINNEMLEALKNEAINGQPVPSMMIMGAMSDIDFAKEAELSNTRLNTHICSYKVDLNAPMSKLYRRIMRWETDIDPRTLVKLRYNFSIPKAKELSVTAEMITNYNAEEELLIKTFLKPDETKEGNPTLTEFRKTIISERLPQINVDKFMKLADEARKSANISKLDSVSKSENLLDDEIQSEEGF